MPRLNENILGFDSTQSVSELLKATRSIKPDYIVLKLSQASPQRADFFVFTGQYLRQTMLEEVSVLKRGSPLANFLPLLTSESAAPQLNSIHVLDSWNELYNDGPWPCAFYPVSISLSHALGVWEANADDMVGSTPSITALEVKTINDDAPNSDPELDEKFDFSTLTPPTPRGPVSTFKEVMGGFFGSDSKKKASTKPADLISLEEVLAEEEQVDKEWAELTEEELRDELFGLTEEGEPEEELAEPEVDIAVDEVESLLQQHTLFPNIEVSNLHPIIEESVHVTVSLQAEQVREITGLVSFPDVGDEDYTYEIKVHLLCGDESQWAVLEYSQGKGMLKCAEFQLAMPDMPLDLSGNYPERHKLPLRVNFYFQNRWCGEGERYLDLRLYEQVKPLQRIPPPPQDAWRQLIKLEPASKPPDLLVRISHKPGTTSYHWSCLSPHMAFNQVYNTIMTLPSSSQVFVNSLFEPFATVELNDHQSTTLKGICEEIYDSAPEVFKQAFWQLSEAAQNASFEFKSILFISDEPYIPWELMRVTDPQLQADAGILATTHSIGRWMANSSNYLTQNISVDQFAVSGSDYVDQQLIPNLPWVSKELEQLSERYQAQRVPLTSDGVMDFLQNGSAQALHFACHGSMSVKTPYKSRLLMEDHPQSITPPNISSYEVETGLGAQHPLVFLNACQAGATANGLSLVSGFPAAFLKAGASAVICPLWTVDDEQAHLISQLFYEAVFEQPGITLGEIMQRIHQRWESEQQLTYLAYVLYGDPQTRVEFLPEIQR